MNVWGWNGAGVDQGDEIAAWGTEVIGRPVRLVAVSRDNPRYVENNPDLGKIGFADGFPLLIVGKESVNQVNTWLMELDAEPVPANRFRANILWPLSDPRYQPKDRRKSSRGPFSAR